MFELKNIKYEDLLDIEKLKIDAKKVTCIIGKSGSGKSTLLKLLDKIISPDEGQVIFNGENIDDIMSIELRRQIGMLSQIPVIFSGSIRENLLIGLDLVEKPRVDDVELLRILKLVNLDKGLGVDIHDLSGGEKQRVCLARLILINPDVYLFDEPSTGLDTENEEIIMTRIIEYIKKNNKTLVMVTHSSEIVNKYSDVVIELSAGKLVRKVDRTI